MEAAGVGQPGRREEKRGTDEVRYFDPPPGGGSSGSLGVHVPYFLLRFFSATNTPSCVTTGSRGCF